MTKFFKAAVSALPALAAVLIFGLSTTRCTSVDDTLGQNFIPPYQQMKLRIDTLPMRSSARTIDTYIATNDTIPSSHQGRSFVGSMTDPVFGRTQASAMTDFFPSSIWAYGADEVQYWFGHHAVADSAYLDIYINAIYGDPSVKQTFYVYELTDSLRRDTVYFFKEPLENRVNLSKPLFSFDMDDSWPAGSQPLKKLEPTAEGMAFLQRLVDLDSTIYKTPYYNFHKEFYGLYIAPDPDGPENAAVYDFGLRTVDEYKLPACGFYVWGHSYEEKNPTKLVDTVAATYRFSDVYLYPNMNVNKVTHTYPAEIADHLNDTLTTDTPLSTVYVQGWGGVAMYLRFTDELLEQLDGLRTQDGVEYSELVINEARLYFPLEDPSAGNMDAAPTRLGMYYTYGQPQREYLVSSYSNWYTVPYYNVTPYYGPKPMLDYAYYSENHPTNPSTIPYGGYISRTKGQGYYKMDVTGYMTLLMNYPDVTPKEVWLGPEINTRATVYNQVALKGSHGEENPIKLVLTYTLIR